jgi:hypothetical protein
MTPIVVNMKTCDPSWGQPGDVRIDRATKWGNPFRLHNEAFRDVVINKYEEYLRANPGLLRDLSLLSGAKRLGCWCKPKACHGDIIIKIMKERGLV